MQFDIYIAYTLFLWIKYELNIKHYNPYYSKNLPFILLIHLWSSVPLGLHNLILLLPAQLPRYLPGYCPWTPCSCLRRLARPALLVSLPLRSKACKTSAHVTPPDSLGILALNFKKTEAQDLILKNFEFLQKKSITSITLRQYLKLMCFYKSKRILPAPCETMTKFVLN